MAALLPPTLPPLAHVTVRVSGVIPAPAADVWKQIRAFGSVSEWMAPVGMERITSSLLPGGVEGQLGALRRLCFGEVGFVEQLDALDDEEFSMKWRVISHPLNSNPFPGSFLNYKARMRLVPVTMQGSAVLDYEGEFETEHTSADVMRRELTARYEASVRGLTTLMQTRTSMAAQQKAAAAALLGSHSYQSAPPPLATPLPAPVVPPVVLGAQAAVAVPAAAPGAAALTALPTPSGVVLPTGAVALMPAMASMGLNPATVPGLSNSMGGVPDLAAAAALHSQPRIVASQGLGGSTSGLYWQVHPGSNPHAAVPLAVPAAQMGSMGSGVGQPIIQPSAAGSVTYSNAGYVSQSGQSVFHSGGGGGMPPLMPQTLMGDGLGLSQSGRGGLVQPVLSGEGLAYGGMMLPNQAAALLPSQLSGDPGLANSFNSITSGESLGSIRGSHVARALQQASAGLLPQQQVAALAALHQRQQQQQAQQAAMMAAQQQWRREQAAAAATGRASFETTLSAPGRVEPAVLNSNGSQHSLSASAASPPCASPSRGMERAKRGGLSQSEAPATLEAAGRFTSL